MDQWILTDSDSAQYARKNTESDFSLIQISGPFPDGNYYVLYDEVDVEAVSPDELSEILAMYCYDDAETVRKICGDAANQVMAECVFETICLRYAHRLYTDKKRKKCGYFVKKYVGKNGGVAE